MGDLDAPTGHNSQDGLTKRLRQRAGRHLRPTDLERQYLGPRLSLTKIILVLALPLTFLAATVVAHVLTGVPFGDISRDPTVTLEGPPLTGIESSIGALLWWSGAAVSLFTFAVLRHVATSDGRPGFFLGAGLITAFLGLDDLLLFHDDIFFNYLGQNERRTMLVYSVVIALFLWRYRKTILASGSLPLLVLAFVFFGGSIGIDQTQSLWGDSEWRILLEDGFKLLGITAWSAYFIRRSYYALSAAPSVSRTSS